MATTQYDFFHYVGPGMFGAHDIYDDVVDCATLARTVDFMSMIVNLPKSGTIEDVGFYVCSVNGGGANRLYEVAIKTLDSAGAVTTTNYGGSSGTVIGSLTDAQVGWNWISLSTPATGTVSEFCGLSLKRISTNGTSGSFSVPIEFIGYTAFPNTRIVSDDEGNVNGAMGFMALRYDDGFVFGLPANKTFNYYGDLNDSPDEFGAKFSVPVKTECVGIRLPFSPTKTVNIGSDVILYDEDDAVLSSVSIPYEDYLSDSFTPPTQTVNDVRFSPVWLEANTTYRLIIRSQSTSWDAMVGGIELITGAYRYCIPEGERWSITYRTNTGSWTDVDYRIPNLAIIADKIEIDTGSGVTGSTTTVILSGQGSYGWAT